MLEVETRARRTCMIVGVFACAWATLSCALVAGIDTFHDGAVTGATTDGSLALVDANAPNVGDGPLADSPALVDDGGSSDAPIESGVPDSAAAIRPSDLVGYYPFDEKGGSTVSDKSGNGNDGTLLGSGNWTAGHLNDGLEFNGSDTCVDLGTPLALRVGPPFTIALWTKVASFAWAGSSAYLLSQTLDPYTAGWRFGTQSPNVYSFKIAVPATEPDPEVVSGVQPEQTWTHVAIVLESAHATLYVNGSAAGSLLNPATISYDTATLRIGCREGFHFFAGIIDEVRLYRAALSAAEIGVLAK